MNFQEMFDVAYKKIKEQGCLSIENKSCVYQTFDDSGKKIRCAIGWLLDAKKFEERGLSLRDLEGSVIRLAHNYTSLGLNEQDPMTQVFLCALQTAHDEAGWADGKGVMQEGAMERFDVNMRALATKYNLKFPE